MSKIIIWGHKLYTHTHSHVHLGFYRAFQYLGYEVLWLDDNDDVSGVDFSDCIFLTCGGACEKMPRRKDCKYILHNCPPMEGVGKFINIQYLTKDSAIFEQISHGITFEGDCVYFPWGSPLLPHEFKEETVTNPRGNDVYFIGTIDIHTFPVINEFARACVDDGHIFYGGGGYTGKQLDSHITWLDGWITEEDQIQYLKEAYMVPAIQNDRQLQNGMIPCRLFKAISYGNDGITNNKFAYEFFDKNIVFGPSDRLYDLFLYAKYLSDDAERRKELMNFVKENHTYLNNIKAILSVL